MYGYTVETWVIDGEKYLMDTPRAITFRAKLRAINGRRQCRPVRSDFIARSAVFSEKWKKFKVSNFCNKWCWFV
jgi:hypothetical protein